MRDLRRANNVAKGRIGNDKSQASQIKRESNIER